jgi:hypothetical protein
MFRWVMAADGHMRYPTRPAEQQALKERHDKKQRHQCAVTQCNRQSNYTMCNLCRAGPGKHAKDQCWIMAEIKACNNTCAPIGQETMDHPRYNPRDTIKSQKPGCRVRASILRICAGRQKDLHFALLKSASSADGLIDLSLRVFNACPTLSLFVYRPPGCEHGYPPACHQDHGETSCPKLRSQEADGLAIMKQSEQKRPAEQEGRGMACALGAHIHECGAGDAGHAVHELNLGTDPHGG